MTVEEMHGGVEIVIHCLRDQRNSEHSGRGKVTLYNLRDIERLNLESSEFPLILSQSNGKSWVL